MMDYTSRLKRTPPMGEPKATEMPAAAAADNTSRFRAVLILAYYGQKELGEITFIAINIAKKLHKKIGATAGNVYKRTFLAQPHPGCHCEALQQSDLASVLVRLTYESEGLDYQSPSSHKSSNHETTKDRFDLRDSTMLCIQRILFHQNTSSQGEHHLRTLDELCNKPTKHSLKIKEKTYTRRTMYQRQI